jgi:hypothetical protein
MGNSSGNLSWYWKYFWDDDYPRLQGGYIWDMIDQGIRQPDVKNGKGFCCNVGTAKGTNNFLLAVTPTSRIKLVLDRDSSLPTGNLTQLSKSANT